MGNIRSPVMGRSRQLAEYMLAWRKRLDRSNIPSLRPRRGQPVTQEEAAFLSNVTHAYYGRLERGQIDHVYSTRTLEDVTKALRLSAPERRVLYVLATNREPEPSPDDAHGLSAATVVWVVGQRWPTFVSTRTFDVLMCNPAGWQWLPDLAKQPNLITVWFTDRTRAQCVDWDTRIAPRAIARLRAQLAALPEDDRLQQVVHEVLASGPLARQLWQSCGNVRWYDDGLRVALTVPGASAPTVAEFVGAALHRSHDLSVTTLVPVDGHIPPPYGRKGTAGRSTAGRGAHTAVARVTAPRAT